MRELLNHLGGFKWLFLLLAVVAVGVTVERLVVLLGARRRFRALWTRVADALARGDAGAAAQACQAAATVTAEVLARPLRRLAAGATDAAGIRHAAQDGLDRALPALERNLGVLAALAGLGPMLGLLGTVWGMIESFREIEAVAAAGRTVTPDLVAGGIWKALTTTAAGLVIGVFSLVAHHGLQGRMLGGVLADMEAAGADLCETLDETREGGDS